MNILKIALINNNLKFMNSIIKKKKNYKIQDHEKRTSLKVLIWDGINLRI